jgi:hypothetical protein
MCQKEPVKVVKPVKQALFMSCGAANRFTAFTGFTVSEAHFSTEIRKNTPYSNYVTKSCKIPCEGCEPVKIHL